MVKTVCLFFYCLLTSQVIGQKDLSLPELSPSSVQNFSNYSSFPSLCFEDAWEDQSGRLWLKVCGATRISSNIHLFQFDGYSFRLIEGALAQLDGNDQFIDLYKNKKVVGFLDDPSKKRLFFYDLYKDQMQFYELEVPGRIAHLKVSERQNIFLTVRLEDKIILYKWESGQLIEEGHFRDRSLIENKTLVDPIQYIHHDENVFWAALGEAGHLLRFDKKNKTQKKILLEEFLEQEQVSSFYKVGSPDHLPVKALVQNENFYVMSNFKKTNNFFKWDQQKNNFKPVENLPSNWNAQNIFNDEIGNVLFLFKDSSKKYQAILQDIKGNRFDYSAFFENIEENIYQIRSSDFKKQVIFCTTRGIVAAKVKASEAIRGFLPDKHIRAMAELPDGRILVNTQYKNQYIINPSNNSSTLLSPPDSCRFAWTRISPDSSENIWTATNDRIYQYNPATNTCFNYPCKSDLIRFFSFINPQEVALINLRQELYFHDLSTQETRPFLEDGKVKAFPGFVNEIIYDPRDFLWVATSKGLFKINLKTGLSEDLRSKALFQSSRFLSMYLDKRGRLWLGTTLHGVYIYDPETGIIKNLNNEDGLPNNTIASIIADEDGDFWVGTYNGISLVSPEGKLITNIYEKDGLTNRENNRYATLKTKDGKLCIGTIKGLNYIDPQKVKERLIGKQDLKIYLNNLRHFDQKLGKDTILEGRLSDIEILNLPASRRFLSIDFSLSNYFKPEENQYAYMLEGIDKDWIDLGNQHFLNLNNLPAGEYRLLVKGSDGRGNWTPQPLVIPIRAEAIFYKQVWFYLLISAIFFAGAFLWITRLRKEVNKATKKIRADKNVIEQQAQREKARAEKMEQQAKQIKIQAQKLSKSLEELQEKNEEILIAQKQLIQQEKLASLGQITAGIAHEIKNPLNFVNNFAEGSIDILKELQEELENNKAQLSEDSFKLILSLINELSQNAFDIQSNGVRVDRIIRSMMDHARGTNSELRPIDLSQLLEDNINLAYHGYRALEPGFNVYIEHENDASIKTINVYPHELGRVFLNLLNNACSAVAQKQKKSDSSYRPLIKVNTYNKKDSVEIRIKDNGPGISNQLKEKIFEPFFTTKKTGLGNTGLGLSISYDIIVNRHEGKLWVVSEPDQFTEFVIILPKKDIEHIANP